MSLRGRHYFSTDSVTSVAICVICVSRCSARPHWSHQSPLPYNSAFGGAFAAFASTALARAAKRLLRLTENGSQNIHSPDSHNSKSPIPLGRNIPSLLRLPAQIDPSCIDSIRSDLR